MIKINLKQKENGKMTKRKHIAKVILLCVLSLQAMAGDTQKEKLLNQLSNRTYMKDYKSLKSAQKDAILEKYNKRERIYNLASKSGVQNSDEYKEHMKIVAKEHAMRLYLQKHRAAIKVSKKELQDYYDAHKRDYTQIHAYTIVRKNKKDLQKYLKILKKSSQKKLEKTFKDLALKYSQHPAKAKSGDLGFIAYNTMVQPFGVEAFALKVNSYTKKPFKTVLGWHLVYVKERKIYSLEKMKKNIEGILISQKYREWFKSL